LEVCEEQAALDNVNPWLLDLFFFILVSFNCCMCMSIKRDKKREGREGEVPIM
jgi:hypothetical protein